MYVTLGYLYQLQYFSSFIRTASPPPPPSPLLITTIPYQTLSVVRLLSRIIFVPFENIQRSITQEQSALWQQIFDCLLSKVSSVVGKVIAMGQWLSSNGGRESFNECLGIVVRGFGEEAERVRVSPKCGLVDLWQR